MKKASTMKKRKYVSVTFVLAAIALPMLSACEEDEGNNVGDGVVAVADHTQNFDQYKTFALMEAGDDQILPDNISIGDITALNNAIVDEMESLGMKKVSEAGDPDLLVGAFIRIDRVDGVATGYWYDMYYGWYWGYYESWYESEEVTFDLGTVVVDAVDVKDQEDTEDDRLVFRGIASGLIYEDAEDATDRIDSAVHYIFHEWP